MGGKNTEPLTRIIGEGHIAARYGLEEAIFLDSIIYWWRTNRDNGRNFEQGRWWTYNTLKTYAERFPWWTEAQLRRIIARCKDKGALLVGNFNEDQRDRTLWYSPSDELLELYGEIPASCKCSNEQMEGAKPQMDVPKGAQSCGENSTALPCSYHDSTNPPYSPPKGDGEGVPSGSRGKVDTELSQAKYKPEWFNIFYALYPRREGRKDAIKAWDKLKPSLELCRVMEAAIRNAQESEWKGKERNYIPHPATWLNGRRWEDEAGPPATAEESSWAPDRESYE